MGWASWTEMPWCVTLDVSILGRPDGWKATADENGKPYWMQILANSNFKDDKIDAKLISTNVLVKTSHGL